MSALLTTPPRATEGVFSLAEWCAAKHLKPLFGLSRSHAYLLLSEGLIRAASIRRPGTIRGRRLFDCTSIRAFLNKHAEGGE
jgi:hypothetical protein